MTNLELITAALREIGVIHEVETPSPEQASHALGKLNRMIEAWTEEDIELGWFEQTSLSDTAPVPKWAEKGVVSKLALELHTNYPSALVSATLQDDGKNGFGTILRKCIVEKVQPADMSHMHPGSGKFDSDGVVSYDIGADTTAPDSVWG